MNSARAVPSEKNAVFTRESVHASEAERDKKEIISGARKQITVAHK